MSGDVKIEYDGIVKTYKSIKGAIACINKLVGESFELYEHSVTAEDGTEISWTGCTVDELFPKTETSTKSKEKEKMNDDTKKFEMKENFVIDSGDARLVSGSLRKGKPEVEGVAAVKAIKEQKDDAGNITQEAVPAVKEIIASPATEDSHEVHLDSISEEVMQEVSARMSDLGFTDKFDNQTIVHNDRFRLTYVAADAKTIRAAFKAVKAKDGYNAPGLAIRVAEAKLVKSEKIKKARKAKKDSESVDPLVEPDSDVWPGEDEGDTEGFDS